MRKILFKAKRRDNGEWVEGYYGKLGYGENVKHYIIQNVSLQEDISYFEDIEICLDTLCQYTGLTDKNGKRIWENDIVKTNQYGVDKGDGRNFSGFDTFHVSFSEGSFCLMNKWRRFNLRPSKNLEVVGNVFDNAYLLEDK